jgi:2-methylcitrate dehydratase
VQALLGKVSVQLNANFSERFPDEMPCRIKITLKDGRVIEQETKDYEGSFTRPMSWEMAIQKFNEIATPHASAAQRTAIADAVANLERVSVRELMQCLATLGHSSVAPQIASVHRES